MLSLLSPVDTTNVSVIPFKTYFLLESIFSSLVVLSEVLYDKVPSLNVKLSVPVMSALPVPSALAFITVYSPSPEIVPNFEKSLSLPSSLAEYVVPSTLKASP